LKYTFYAMLNVHVFGADAKSQPLLLGHILKEDAPFRKW